MPLEGAQNSRGDGQLVGLELRPARGLSQPYGWAGSTSGLGTKTAGDQSPRESVGRTDLGGWGKRSPKKGQPDRKEEH